jgi:hypothetical protein
MNEDPSPASRWRSPLGIFMLAAQPIDNSARARRRISPN